MEVPDEIRFRCGKVMDFMQVLIFWSGRNEKLFFQAKVLANSQRRPNQGVNIPKRLLELILVLRGNP